ncbi:hypothetical protein BKD09_17770 [Bradyrhizobium japonicum]|uniref:Putative HNH nuclease YajD n=1 Tax=Bradyrhizobium japonicum TaxID=375 RepID=A0A1L3FA30_BRAJP|nr:HNH endonuclease [Bradyrhizobium japonicum]APG10179.1 hypothetical protein BKD09_17770 [Bradyrhizobium japonicum]
MGFYGSAEWQRARLQALHDGGWQCQRCGTSLIGKGREAHVHHRKELKRAPSLRSEPLNLMALCRLCHTIEHKAPNKPTGNASADGSPTDPRHPWAK